jgi:hypothetical protein
MHRRLVFILAMFAMVIGSLSQAAIASATGPTPVGPTLPAPTHVRTQTYAPFRDPARVIVWWREKAVVTGFVIQRATNSRFTTGFATFRASAYARRYTLPGLLRDAQYYIRIRAFKGHAHSRWRTVTETTPE